MVMEHRLFDLTAEENVLGAAMMDGDSINEVTGFLKVVFD